jgi:hypothetical protein
MTTQDRRAIAAEITRLTNHGQHLAAYALWLRTIAPCRK